VLILGTMPGEESLRRQQYYGNSRNAFWKIIYALFDREPDAEYEKRKMFLLEHGIAVWDVIMRCEREGSRDNNIKNPVPNDLQWLFRTYPNIRNICFNGGEAQKFYRRLIENGIGFNAGREFHKLPSTSPSYSKISFSEKLERWKLIKNLI